jgi:polyhydroxyalkanoate synthesis regulator phasin
MRAKTLIDLLTISTNLYMISKDEKFVNNLKEMAEKGREKASAWAHEFSGTAEEETLFERLKEKAGEAREELENKISEVAEKVYEKMNIAHTSQINQLEAEICLLRRELALAESRLVTLETRK